MKFITNFKNHIKITLNKQTLYVYVYVEIHKHFIIIKQTYSQISKIFKLVEFFK